MSESPASNTSMKRTDRGTAAIAWFVATALGLSVAYWVLFYLRARGQLPFDPSGGGWGALRGYGPTLALLVTAWLVAGRGELAAVRARLLRWRFSVRLWLLAVLGPALAAGVMVLVVRALGVEAQAPTGPLRPPRLVLIFFVFALIDGPLGEEIGWRGFLLPRLLERWSAVTASLLLGVVWYLWHLPLYHATGKELTAAFLVAYLLNNLSWSLVHTWFFTRSGGSALLAVVLHTAGNYFVYLATVLFPEMGSAPEARQVHLTVLVLAGIAAAWALRRGKAVRGPHPAATERADNPAAP